MKLERIKLQSSSRIWKVQLKLGSHWKMKISNFEKKFPTSEETFQLL